MSSRHALYAQLSPSPARNGKPAADTGLPSRLPEPCGVLSGAVVRALTADGSAGPRPAPRPTEVHAIDDPLADRDFQLALWLLYEQHYRGFEGVPDRLEWDPLLLAAKTSLEQRFEAAIRELVGDAADLDLPDGPGGPADAERVADQVVQRLVRMTRTSPAPGGMPAFLAHHATTEQFVAYLRQRAVYHLHESDPQSFVLPRIGGRAKVALAELQYDEYGAGRPERLHASWFARGLAALDLPTELTPYVEEAEAETLASVNTMSLFALNRRLRGAALGHLAAFEATSSLPCSLVADGARRLGLPQEVIDYYEEHVEADAVHEQLAIRDVCGALVAEQPALASDVLFGAAACLAVDGHAGDVLLVRWRITPVRGQVAS